MSRTDMVVTAGMLSGTRKGWSRTDDALYRVETAARSIEFMHRSSTHL